MIPSILFREPLSRQPIDQCPYEVFGIIFGKLNGVDLVRCSRLSTKWYNWVLRYAQTQSPNLVSHLALAQLVQREIPFYNLKKGRFCQIEISRDIAFNTNKIFSVDSGYLAEMKGYARISIFSQRRGLIERAVLIDPSELTWFGKKLLWRESSNSLIAWELSSGSLRHTFRIVGNVQTIKEEKGHIAIFTEKEGQHRVYVLPFAQEQLKELQLPVGYEQILHSGGCHFDYCFRGETVSLICYNDQKRVRVSYDLESVGSILLPQTQRNFYAPFKRGILRRLECHQLTLLHIDQGNGKLRWSILNEQGGVCFPHEIFDLTHTAHEILLLTSIKGEAILRVFDPIHKKIKGGQNLEVPLDANTPFCSLMVAVDEYTAVIFLNDLCYIWDFKELVAQAQPSPFHGYPFKGKKEELVFDGEKIFLCSNGRRGKVIADYGVIHAAPRRQWEEGSTRLPLATQPCLPISSSCNKTVVFCIYLIALAIIVFKIR